MSVLINRLPKVSLFNAILCALFILSACSSNTKVESDLGLKGAPDWVNKGKQALSNKKGRYFHGSGSAPAMSDTSLQRSTADNRARAELAQIFSSYMNVLASDYGAALSDGEQTVSEQSLSRTIENTTKLNLQGAEIIARWKDPKTGVVYSLAELDMNKFKTIIHTASQMHPDFKTFVSSKADDIFDSFNSKGQ
ncbi:MAG: LPP20 family lipoprotein [Cellvibrionaceae bacterium]|nr:LPP20 family lipoprotein [Cellvibrionaceae bacterium]